MAGVLSLASGAGRVLRCAVAARPLRWLVSARARSALAATRLAAARRRSFAPAISDDPRWLAAARPEHVHSSASWRTRRDVVAHRWIHALRPFKASSGRPRCGFEQLDQ